MQTPDSLMQYASLAYDCAAPRIRVGPAARGQPLRECAILVGTDWPAEWGINELWMILGITNLVTSWVSAVRTQATWLRPFRMP